MRRLLRWLKRLNPVENGPRQRTSDRLLRIFRINSAAWDENMSRADRVRRLLMRATTVPFRANYRSALAGLIADYQATNVTRVELAWIEAVLFGRSPAPAELNAWVKVLCTGRADPRLTPLEFTLVFGALELTLGVELNHEPARADHDALA